MEIQVGLEAVVDVPARGLAAGVADRLVHRGRGLGDEEEVVAGEQSVPQGVVLVGEGAGQVEIEAVAPAAARVPGPVAGLLAAVAQEGRVRGHQLQLVRRVSVIEDLGWRILVRLCMILLLLSHLKGHTYSRVG